MFSVQSKCSVRGAVRKMATEKGRYNRRKENDVENSVLLMLKMEGVASNLRMYFRDQTLKESSPEPPGALSSGHSRGSQIPASRPPGPYQKSYVVLNN